DIEPIVAPRPLKALGEQRKHLHRKLSRCTLHSNEWYRIKDRLAKLEAKIARVRRDATHKATTSICRECAVLVIEDLNVEGMKHLHSQAESITDVNFGEIRRQLAYKCPKYGCVLVIAPRFYASSKLCSECGYKNK